ncbi:hypothetical protein [Paenibacillus sp. An7]|uniref:hypothetical protein n=1 Tax=Paenibacillus sp. An7 TaxID=2689577 RepID=UPI001356D434|nr:hypothetical protein [Paenibacillus sp. An7]
MKEYILFLHRNGQLLFTLAYSLTRDLDQAGELLAEGVAVYWSELKEDEQQNELSLLREKVEDQDHIFVSHMYGIFSALVHSKVQYKRNENLSNYGIEHQMISDRSLAMEESISTLKNELRSLFLLSYLFGWEKEKIAAYTDLTIQIVEKKQNEIISILHRSMSSHSGEISPLFLDRHFENERAAIASMERELIRISIGKGLSPAGLNKGNKWRARKRKKVWFLGMAGAIIAGVLLLFLTGFPKSVSIDNSKDKFSSIPDGQVTMIKADGSYFKKAAAQEVTLLKRLQSDSEQPKYLGYTVRQKGTRLTIDGMMTMGSETIIWYSLENEEGDGTPKVISGTLDSDFGDSAGVLRDHRELTTNVPSKVQGQIIFDRLDTFDYKPEMKQPLPAVLRLDVYLGPEKSDYTAYQIDIPGGEEDNVAITINPNQQIEFGEYKITLTEVNYTKYVTEVKWESDSANPKDIDHLLEPMLLMKVEEGNRHFPAIRTSADGRTIYFPALAYEGHVNPTEFQISGALTALENQEFIVNTDQGELLDAPASFDGTYEIEKDVDKGTITFHYTITDQENWLFLENQYRDELGNKHDVLEKKRVQNQFSYTFADQEYSQPVHFIIMGYPDQIVQEAKVRINE